MRSEDGDCEWLNALDEAILTASVLPPCPRHSPVAPHRLATQRGMRHNSRASQVEARWHEASVWGGPSERWLSGRKRRFAKSVTWKRVRRFESCPLRSLDFVLASIGSPDSVCSLYIPIFRPSILARFDRL